MSKKITYLDSGVLIAATQADHKLFEEVFAVLDDPEREFISSDFVMLEVLPKPTFLKRALERDMLLGMFDESVSTVPTSSEKIKAALVLACRLNLSAVDAIHFQTAIESNVDEFITTEKSTKPFFQQKSCPFAVISLIGH